MKPSAQALVCYGPRVLLVQRGPTAPWAPNLWGLPGGYVERGETPTDAVVRELSEEVGIEWPYRLQFVALAPWPAPSYLFRVTRPLAYPFHVWLRDGEHVDYAWVHPLEALQYPSTSRPLAPGVSLALSLEVSDPRRGHRGA